MKLLMFLLSISMCAVAAEKPHAVHREHKAHTHGMAKLDIAIEKDTIEADLDIPGMDLMGFEGTAKTDKQKKSLKKVTDMLTKDYNLFLIDESAGCAVTKRELELEASEKDHSGYEYEISYKCKDISKVKELDVNLFRDINTLKEVTVQLVTDTIQKELKVYPTKSKIQL